MLVRVAHTHAAAVAGQRQFDLSMLRLTPDDAVSGAVLFAHIMGTIVLQHTLRSGARFVTLPRFSPEPFLRAVQHHKITVAFGAPPLARLLVSHPQAARSDLSSLRLVVLGAAPVPPAMQQACQARLGCTVAQGFGMSEAWTIAAPAYPEQVVHGSVGRLLPGVEAVIVDPASGARLDAGQPGELWVRGPQLMQGYVGEQEATAATLDSEGWLRTGDLGYFDTDGNLFITDRVKELIKYKGLQVAPAELEAVLTEHPDVADAAVIPRPHPDAGQVPVAYDGQALTSPRCLLSESGRRWAGCRRTCAAAPASR